MTGPTQKKVVAVCGDSHREEFLDALMCDGDNGYDVFYIESIERGYSRVKQVIPDLVIVLCEIDDVAACHLLSMLKVDTALSTVPVLTFPAQPHRPEWDTIIAEASHEPSDPVHAISMN